MKHTVDDAPLTVEEFLRFEEHAEERHEFVGGRIYAMTGATTRHNRICGNVYLRLRTLAESGPCRVYMEGVQLRLPDDVYYPDVMVVCAPDGDDERRAHAPCLVVEVRSPSTGAIDLYGHKLHGYQGLPSVLAYLVVEQHRRCLTHHWRASPRSVWQREELVDVGAVRLPCPIAGAALTLDQVYDGIALPPRPALRRLREPAPD